MKRPNRNQRRDRSRTVRGPALTITLTPQLSRQWAAASERAGVPLDWMLYDALTSEAAAYLESGTGYREDSREVWWVQRHKKVPLKVVKVTP